MNWERTMRELHSIRARMRRERYWEELKMLMRQEAAEKITELKDKSAVRNLLEYRELLPNALLTERHAKKC
jgi:hypothetical protein